jgi:hypothetical protein
VVYFFGGADDHPFAGEHAVGARGISRIIEQQGYV